MSSGAKDKRIYIQDRLFCAKSEKGDWYIASTTENPEARKFGGMNYIAKIDGFPPENIRTGESEPYGKGPNPKIRWYLDKVKLTPILRKQYNWEVVEEDSPYLPKKLSLTEEPETQPEEVTTNLAVKRKREQEPENLAQETIRNLHWTSGEIMDKLNEIVDKLVEIQRLLLAIHSSRVQYEAKTTPVHSPSTSASSPDDIVS